MKNKHSILYFLIIPVLVIFSCSVELPLDESNDTLNIGTLNGKWFTGFSPPSPTLGEDGDLYLDSETGNVYLKLDGAWKSVADISGPAGEDGSAWISGNGIPNIAIGTNGDFYFDKTSGNIYEKSGGIWLNIANLSGDDGLNGTTWYSGSTTPSSSIGSQGDFYLNTTDGTLFKKQSSVWVSIANIMGKDGADGEDGSVWFSGQIPPENSLGYENDFYLDAFRGIIYQKTGGQWTSVANIIGPDGNVGVTWYSGNESPPIDLGSDSDLYLNIGDGTIYLKAEGAWLDIGNVTSSTSSGAVWLTGSGAPSSDIGTNGDLYLDTYNGDVYKKETGVWLIIANITGPQGADLTVNAWVTTMELVDDTSYMIALRMESTGELMLVGSGAAINSNTIITNAHVYLYLLASYILYEQIGIEVTPVAVRNGDTAYGAFSFPLDVAGIHAQYDASTVFTADIAFFTTQTAIPNSIELPSDVYIKAASVGQDIGSLGFPQETGERISHIAIATFKDGVISSLTPFDPYDIPSSENTYVVQHNLDTTGGTSGSPIFDLTGKLLAVNNSGAGMNIWDDATHDFRFVPTGSVGYGIRADVVNEMFANANYMEDIISSWYIPDRYKYAPGSGISLYNGTLPVLLGTSMSIAQNAANSLFGKVAPDYITPDGHLIYSDYNSYNVALLKNSVADQLWSISISDMESPIYLSPFRDIWGITIGTSRTYILNTYGYVYSNTFSGDGTVYYYNYSNLGIGFGFKIVGDYDWYCDYIQIAISGYLPLSQSVTRELPNLGINDFALFDRERAEPKLPLEVLKSMR